MLLSFKRSANSIRVKDLVQERGRRIGFSSVEKVDFRARSKSLLFSADRGLLWERTASGRRKL